MIFFMHFVCTLSFMHFVYTPFQFLFYKHEINSRVILSGIYCRIFFTKIHSLFSIYFFHYSGQQHIFFDIMAILMRMVVALTQCEGHSLRSGAWRRAASRLNSVLDISVCTGIEQNNWNTTIFSTLS